MKENTVMAILFISVTIFGAIVAYAEARTYQAAMQAGLQECIVRLDYGIKKVWQKECTK